MEGSEAIGRSGLAAAGEHSAPDVTGDSTVSRAQGQGPSAFDLERRACRCVFIDLSRNHLDQYSLPAAVQPLHDPDAADTDAGELPDQFQDCPTLTPLDLSNNRLASAVPSSLSSCQRLVKLNLRHNRLTGEIPKPLTMMPAMAIHDAAGDAQPSFPTTTSRGPCSRTESPFTTLVPSVGS